MAMQQKQQMGIPMGCFLATRMLIRFESSSHKNQPSTKSGGKARLPINYSPGLYFRGAFWPFDWAHTSTFGLIRVNLANVPWNSKNVYGIESFAIRMGSAK